MVKYLFILLTLSFYHLVTSGQDSILSKQNIIRILNRDSLNNEIYNGISKYKLIMMGETHGTNEPAMFVYSLVYLLVREGAHVQIGLEIPSSRMSKFLSSPTDSNIYSADFFTKQPIDGRSNFALANLIAKLNGALNVEIFFYDINPEESVMNNNRDSMMFIKIKKRIQLHPSWKTITLSGNIHNMLKPYNGKTKMGLYLYKDQDLNISSQILSLDHKYALGTTWADTDIGLQLQQTDFSDSFFAKLVDYPNYLFLYPEGGKTVYSGIYFTRNATAARLIR